MPSINISISATDTRLEDCISSLPPLARYYADTKVALNPFRQLGILARAHLPESGADTWLNLNFAAHNYIVQSLHHINLLKVVSARRGYCHTLLTVSAISLPLYGK